MKRYAIRILFLCALIGVAFLVLRKSANQEMAIGDDVFVQKTCSQAEKNYVSISKCSGYYHVNPLFIADIGTTIYNSSGEPIDYCGGYGRSLPIISKYHDWKCSRYSENCVQLVEACSVKGIGGPVEYKLPGGGSGVQLVP